MSTEENNPLGLPKISVTKNIIEFGERFDRLYEISGNAIGNLKSIGRGLLIYIIRVEYLQTTVDLHEDQINTQRRRIEGLDQQVVELARNVQDLDSVLTVDDE